MKLKTASWRRPTSGNRNDVKWPIWRSNGAECSRDRAWSRGGGRGTVQGVRYMNDRQRWRMWMSLRLGRTNSIWCHAWIEPKCRTCQWMTGLLDMFLCALYIDARAKWYSKQSIATVVTVMSWIDTEFLKRSNNEQDSAWTREHLLDLVKRTNQ